MNHYTQCEKWEKNSCDNWKIAAGMRSNTIIILLVKSNYMMMMMLIIINFWWGRGMRITKKGNELYGNYFIAVQFFLQLKPE